MKDNNPPRVANAPKSPPTQGVGSGSSGSAISDAELNKMLHDCLLDQLLDELGAPTEQSGGKLSPYGRLRRVADGMIKMRAALARAHKFFSGGIAEADFSAIDPEERKLALRLREELQSMEDALQNE